MHFPALCNILLFQATLQVIEIVRCGEHKRSCTQMYSALRAGVGFELPHLLPAHCYEGKVAVGVVCVGFNHSVRESLRGHLAV